MISMNQGPKQRIRGERSEHELFWWIVILINTLTHIGQFEHGALGQAASYFARNTILTTFLGQK